MKEFSLSVAEKKLREELTNDREIILAGKLKTYGYEEMKKLTDGDLVRHKKKYAKREVG